MPKVKPLGTVQKLENRWTAEDENFKEQLAILKVKSGKNNLHDLSEEAGLPRQRLSALKREPRKMKKLEERKLICLFEKYGMRYDVTLGGAGYAAVAD